MLDAAGGIELPEPRSRSDAWSVILDWAQKLPASVTHRERGIQTELKNEPRLMVVAQQSFERLGTTVGVSRGASVGVAILRPGYHRGRDPAAGPKYHPSRDTSSIRVETAAMT
ncbi:MAG: hypothetical protein U9O63_06055, partial [Actinomycetota bacterium]|nr:hypothetical protein [Actinomycetota bacterium]